MELVNTVPKINPEDFEDMVNSNMKVSAARSWVWYVHSMLIVNFLTCVISSHSLADCLCCITLICLYPVPVTEHADVSFNLRQAAHQLQQQACSVSLCRYCQGGRGCYRTNHHRATHSFSLILLTELIDVTIPTLQTECVECQCCDLGPQCGRATNR